MTIPPVVLPLEDCPGCRVAPGTAHDEGCDHARCPDCGEQLIYHYCERPSSLVPRPAMWHGVHPDEEVARTRNWWTTIVGIDEPVPDSTRVAIAEALGMVTWDPEAQRYVIGDVDEARLDRVLRDNGIGR